MEERPSKRPRVDGEEHDPRETLRTEASSRKEGEDDESEEEGSTGEQPEPSHASDLYLDTVRLP